MTNEAIQELLDTSRRMVEATPTALHRYMMGRIDWRDRFICVEGARGTGKSTIMRQRIKEGFGVEDKAAYMSVLEGAKFYARSKQNWSDAAYAVIDAAQNMLTGMQTAREALDDAQAVVE